MTITVNGTFSQIGIALVQTVTAFEPQRWPSQAELSKLSTSTHHPTAGLTITLCFCLGT